MSIIYLNFFLEGFSPETSLELIEFYFDNKRKSGGGGVRYVEPGPADGQAIVYFDDWKGKQHNNTQPCIAFPYRDVLRLYLPAGHIYDPKCSKVRKRI